MRPTGLKICHLSVYKIITMGSNEIYYTRKQTRSRISAIALLKAISRKRHLYRWKAPKEINKQL
jgi:hypothetical protein